MKHAESPFQSPEDTLHSVAEEAVVCRESSQFLEQVPPDRQFIYHLGYLFASLAGCNGAIALRLFAFELLIWGPPVAFLVVVGLIRLGHLQRRYVFVTAVVGLILGSVVLQDIVLGVFGLLAIMFLKTSVGLFCAEYTVKWFGIVVSVLSFPLSPFVNIYLFLGLCFANLQPTSQITVPPQDLNIRTFTLQLNWWLLLASLVLSLGVIPMLNSFGVEIGRLFSRT